MNALSVHDLDELHEKSPETLGKIAILLSQIGYCEKLLRQGIEGEDHFSKQSELDDLYTRLNRLMPGYTIGQLVFYIKEYHFSLLED